MNEWEKKIDRIVNNVNKFIRIHQEYIKKKGLKNKHRNISESLESLKKYFKENKWEEK